MQSLILYVAIISYIPQVHQIVFFNWHVPNEWMESAITAITFPAFFMDKEKEEYDSLYYFCLGIPEEISLSLVWKTQSILKNYVQEWCENWKTRYADCEEKMFIIYKGHPPKNLRHYVESFSEAYLGSIWISTIQLFCESS